MYFQFSALFYLLAIFFAGCRNPIRKAPKCSLVTKLKKREQLVAGCVVCHGVQEAQRGPILNGMENWYLRDQIEKFPSGVRGAHPPNRSEHLMGIRCSSISNELEAAYLVGSPRRNLFRQSGRFVEIFELGGELYQRRCVSCHGESGGGKSAINFPIIDSYPRWYFYQQMRKFREGKRGHYPRDEGGRVTVRRITGFVRTHDIKNIVAYCIDSFGLPEAVPKKPTSSPKPF